MAAIEKHNGSVVSSVTDTPTKSLSNCAVRLLLIPVITGKQVGTVSQPSLFIVVRLLCLDRHVERIGERQTNANNSSGEIVVERYSLAHLSAINSKEDTASARAHSIVVVIARCLKLLLGTGLLDDDFAFAGWSRAGSGVHFG